MVVRIRFGRGTKVQRKRRKNRRAALALAALLTPAAFMAGVLGMWRLTSDLNWTGSFAIASGPFSHWQVWIALAAILQLCAHGLNRYGRAEDTATT